MKQRNPVSRRDVCLAAALLCVASSGVANAAQAGAVAARKAEAIRAGQDFSGAGKTKVVMLGSGTPIPLLERAGPAVAVIVDDRPYLVDAGEGSWRASQAAT